MSAPAPRPTSELTVALTGASGLIGRALSARLSAGGAALVRLVRREPAAPNEIRWDPEGGGLDRAALHGVDAVVHLAGEPIEGRWTRRKKEAILRSRTSATSLVARAVAELDPPPRALVCASAIGIYGDRGDEALTEASPPGHGFLADVVQAWEAAATPAREAGVRVVHLRMGVILESVVPRIAVPFRLGLGGRLGSGCQYWSWVALDDVLGAFLAALESEKLTGPVNVVAPDAVRNAEFTHALATALRRPALLPIPAPALRALLGELADEVLLASQRVVPEQLEARGFPFERPDLGAALTAALARRVPQRG